MSDPQPEEELTFEGMLDRIGELVEGVERIPDAEVRDDVMELLDYLSAWHREALTRFATAVPPDILQGAREDPVVAHLLDTYLSEDDGGDPSEVIEEALEEIRPYVHSHGGEMEVLGVDGGVVTLQLMGSCQGCPSSSVTLTQGVEKILRDKWPGFRELKVEGDLTHDHAHGHGGPQLLQIQSLRKK